MNNVIGDFVNKINFVSSAFFVSYGLVKMFNGHYMYGVFMILLGVFILLSVVVYSFTKNLKRKAHKMASVLDKLKKSVSIDPDEFVQKNKLMSLVFLIELNSYKKTNKSFTDTAWAWDNKNPVNPLIVNLLTSLNHLTADQIDYTLNEDELKLIDSVLSECGNLSKIDIDAYIINNFPSVASSMEDNKFISFKDLYEK